jgi:hypothetical protein
MTAAPFGIKQRAIVRNGRAAQHAFRMQPIRKSQFHREHRETMPSTDFGRIEYSCGLPNAPQRLLIVDLYKVMEEFCASAQLLNGIVHYESPLTCSQTRS